MLNKVMLIGRLGRDPEMRFTPQGDAVTTMSVATTRTWRDGDKQEHKETEWHTVVAWRKLAEACNNHLHKGSLVYIEGRNHTRQWEDDQQVKHRRTEVIAEEVKFLDSRRDEAGPEE